MFGFEVDAKKLQKAEAKLKEKLEKRTGSDPKLRPAEMWAFDCCCFVVQLGILWYFNLIQQHLKYTDVGLEMK